ncbi:MAG TPA: VOC family protein [Candidatus Aquilonibacter sp.]|nr:VOC family protein [Candidatus Aquilonibacter sp.]
MGTSIFVNLPVKDLKKTMAFFSKLGFKYNKQFTDKNAACMVIERNIFAMLLVKKFFKGFIKKEIANSAKTTEAIISLSAPSKKKVDWMVDRAVAAGAIEGKKQDLGFMYSRSFEDLDGHSWDLFWMDPKNIKKE